jgi:hypothetical protein
MRFLRIYASAAQLVPFKSRTSCTIEQIVVLSILADRKEP